MIDDQTYQMREAAQHEFSQRLERAAEQRFIRGAFDQDTVWTGGIVCAVTKIVRNELREHFAQFYAAQSAAAKEPYAALLARANLAFDDAQRAGITHAEARAVNRCVGLVIAPQVDAALRQEDDRLARIGRALEAYVLARLRGRGKYVVLVRGKRAA